MKKTLLILLVLLLCVSLFGCANNGGNTPPVQTAQEDENEITALVEEFGAKMQNVSLLAPEDTVKQSMEENYGELVTPTLLEKWQEDPENAPGRVTSSPWPERIEIESIEKQTDSSYTVTGEVIEVTSVEKENGGAAAERPITLVVEKIDNKWLITSVELGDYGLEQAAVYENTQYGFLFFLPESWVGFTTVHEEWEGIGIDSGKLEERGPLLSLRHPEWTKEAPRQDIPILIFTTEQWALISQEKLSIGAAPMGPSELGRNSQYVFALPARYNYAFPEGFEEVEDILEGKPLQADDSLLQ